tara:strand:- start:547 stop:711 length:165 start_codon:yes stop_codon:yes gene_type:complete
LIDLLEDKIDQDYEPEIKDVIRDRNESYEYEEGSCEEEEVYSFTVDANGFHSLI